MQEVIKGTDVSTSNIDRLFINVLATGDAQQLREYCGRLQKLAAVLSKEGPEALLCSLSDQRSIAEAVGRVSLLASSFAACERTLYHERQEMTATACRILEHGSPHIRSPDINNGSREGTQASAPGLLNGIVMRDWLYSHIDHPFPSNDDKESIIVESNEGPSGGKVRLKTSQCTLWFINARRRSGWTAWSRRFGDGDRNRIRAIVAAIRGHQPPKTSVVDRLDEIETRLEELVVAKEDLDRHLSKHELAELCRREFQKVIDWIQQGPGQKVGDWMDEIAAEAKTISSKKRKCVDDDKDHGQARKVVRDTRSARRQVAQDEGSSTANIEEVEYTEHDTPSRRAAPPRRDFSGPSTCSYSSFSSFVSGNTMANSSTTSLTSFDEGATHPSCPVTAFDESPPLVATGSSGESSRSASYESPPALTPDAEAFVRRYLEEQRAQNAESMAASAPHPARLHSPPAPERLIRKLPARGVAQAQYSEGNIFRPPVTAQAATGANWGLPATPASIRSTNTSRQASHSSDTLDYGGWLPFVGED